MTVTLEILTSPPATTVPVLIGVAHELQRVDSLQPEEWDVRLDMVVTDQATYR